MALTKTARTIVSPASNAAGSTTRGAIDLEAAYGGLLTMKITNGGTGPSTQCVCNVLIAHNSTLPAAGSAGSTWKTLFSFGGGLSAGASIEQSFSVDPAVMAMCVEFTGNTGQAVTVEASLSEITTL